MHIFGRMFVSFPFFDLLIIKKVVEYWGSYIFSLTFI
jgi:hypothetical protein